MLKIWGRRNSVNVQKVLWCADELKLEYQQIDAGLTFGVTNDPWFLDINPNGLVPTIDHDGRILWESNAILRYFGATFGVGTLWPDKPYQQAQCDMWMDWQLGMVMPGLNPVFLGLVRTPPEKRNLEMIALGEARLKKAFTSLDRHLAENLFTGGENFTVSDIAVGCAVSRWLLLNIDRPELPHLKKWFDAISGRSGFQANVLQELS